MKVYPGGEEMMALLLAGNAASGKAQAGDVRQGVVKSVDRGKALVELDGSIKWDGLLEVSKEDTREVGDEITVVLKGTNEERLNSTGTVNVKVDEFPAYSQLEEGETVEVTVTQEVKGGFIGEHNGVKVFIPFSHAIREQNSDLINQKIPAVILEKRRREKSIVCSHSEALIEGAVGSLREGKATRVTKFGTFVKFEDGLTGLIHDRRQRDQVGETIGVLVHKYSKKHRSFNLKRINVGKKNVKQRKAK